MYFKNIKSDDGHTIDGLHHFPFVLLSYLPGEIPTTDSRVFLLPGLGAQKVFQFLVLAFGTRKASKVTIGNVQLARVLRKSSGRDPVLCKRHTNSKSSYPHSLTKNKVQRGEAIGRVSNTPNTHKCSEKIYAGTPQC